MCSSDLYLSNAGISAFKGRVVQAGSKLAVEACKNNQWAGQNECIILGQIAADYIKSPKDTDWLEFLAQEAGKIGVTLLLADAFPKNSPERARLVRQARQSGVPILPAQPSSTTPPKPSVKSTPKQIAVVGGLAALALYLVAGD